MNKDHILSDVELIEFQCKLENNIMASYGYTLEDFEDDDWRQVFDDIMIYHNIVGSVYTNIK